MLSRLIDLTVPVNQYPGGGSVESKNYQVTGCLAGNDRTFNCHRLKFEANSGTHICFPAHLVGASSPLRNENFSIEGFWQVPTTVLAVKADPALGITAEFLERALRGRPVLPHVIVHAPGGAGDKEIPGVPRPWLSECGVEWLLSKPFRTLISNALEPSEPAHKTGICPRLYEMGRCLVFALRHAELLPAECATSIVPLCAEGLTQAPCRLIAQV